MSPNSAKMLEATMQAKPIHRIFRFENNVRWESGRNGSVSVAGKPRIHISSPPQFGGKPELWSPEDLLLAAVNACVMQTFVTFAVRANLPLVSYESVAEGVLERAEGRYRFTEFNVYPVLVLNSEQDLETARLIMESAECSCLITESVRARIRLSPDFRINSRSEQTEL
jgi:organic hydroperoxide reductase OsmC/OhrA